MSFDGLDGALSEGSIHVGQKRQGRATCLISNPKSVSYHYLGTSSSPYDPWVSWCLVCRDQAIVQTKQRLEVKQFGEATSVRIKKKKSGSMAYA